MSGKKCGVQRRTHDMEVPDSNLAGSSPSILWQDTSNPDPSTGETHEIHEHVNCRHDIT